ncbi:MAG: gliding motility-associated C-terminal domain-containing protein [Putridiphycobacter sp.]|nr:gliding motility-associated C-terminal domain-containing protein [Putridiphycobacter sp.]
MIRKITLLGLTMFAICWQTAISQTANFSIDQGTNVCVNECITITDLSTAPGNIDNYSWSISSTNPNVPVLPNPNDPDPTDQDPLAICFSEAGSYLISLQITDDVGNVANANVQVEVVVCPGSLAAGFISKSTVCLNECVTMIDTSVGVPTSYTWTALPAGSAVTSTPDIADPTFCFLDASVPVEISLTVTNADGKISKFTKQIDVVTNPTVAANLDTIVELGNPAIISAFATGATKYRWEPSTSVVNPKVLTTFAYPEETTDYVITVEDGNGCTASDTVKVYLNFVPQIGVPTAFSPNGDGKNDLLVVKGLALSKCIFKVYNRYGIQVFESDTQKNGWDGNYKGKPMDPGVFHWTLEYEFNTGKSGILSGNTTLVR